MEFFKIVEVHCSESHIQNLLKLENIESYCPSLFPIEAGHEQCLIGSNWGEYTLRRDCITGGVRFSMLDCPNAMAWTITTGYPPQEDAIVIHLTINRTEKDDEFIEEIQMLLEELITGVGSVLAKNSEG